MEGRRPADAPRSVPWLKRDATADPATLKRVCAPDLEREAAELDRTGVHQRHLRIGEDPGEDRAGRRRIANLLRLDQPATEDVPGC